MTLKMTKILSREGKVEKFSNETEKLKISLTRDKNWKILSRQRIFPNFSHEFTTENISKILSRQRIFKKFSHDREYLKQQHFWTCVWT